ncbi:hypothetical protein BDW02DRAFT_398184 [Decorospora gaudefroyi]|uniref:Uncharacterized protein n=1 Tax=Decorospora gaudefroyi TaxID=184978 RepID=A0A6A5K5U4_9PLEO|nr:hypothetical protein BDW02DRAFT_398184 [Decorospora gaudefroyi]
MESADLQKSYSREQQGLGPDHEAITSPVALVRSFTSKSQRSSRSRQSSSNRAEVGSSRAPRLRDIGKEVDCLSDTEKDDPIEKVASRRPSPSSSQAETESRSDASGAHDGDARGRRIIPFEDGDPENPNNWGRWKKIYALLVAIMSVINSTMN